MICIKTPLKEMPNNCKDCNVICDLPYRVANGYAEYVDSEYINKKHAECNLIEVDYIETLKDALRENCYAGCLYGDLQYEDVITIIKILAITKDVPELTRVVAFEQFMEGSVELVDFLRNIGISWN